MKKIFLFIFITLTFTACSQQQKKTDGRHEMNFPKYSLAIVNPTVSNIKTFRYLIDNNILPDSDSFGIIGIYHSKQRYNFEHSQRYIDDNNLAVKLVECKAELSPKNIYNHNDCSNLFREVFEQTEGIFFFGGPDIPAGCFGEKTHLMTDITDPYRHFFELSFLFHLLGGSQNENHTALLDENPDYIVVGFCLGMQTMNCATGGTMFQDIPMEVYNISTAEDMLQSSVEKHKNYNAYFDFENQLTGYCFHKIKAHGENFISEIIGNTEPYVLSFHHQAVNSIGKDFDVAATSPDGKIVEIILHKKYPYVVGTQFHPENTSLYNTNSKIQIDFDTPDNQNFLLLYGGEKGENFHRTYWNTIGEWLNNNKKR